METLALRLIKRHEGLRLKPYLCPAGKLTIGYGRNLEDNGISETEAIQLLEHDVSKAFNDAQTLPCFRSLTPVRQAVMVDMTFNLGLSRLTQFHKMFAAIEHQDWETTGNEMLNSRWARQVGQRAQTLSQMMTSNLAHLD